MTLCPTFLRKQSFVFHLHIRQIALALVFTLVNIEGYAQPTAYTIEAKTSCYNMFFSVNLFDFNSQVRSNCEAAKALDAYISDYIWHNQVDSVSVYVSISAFASFEGKQKHNEELAEKRAIGIKNYLLKNYPVLQQCSTLVQGLGEDWRDFRVMAANDSLVPFQTELLEIVDNNQLDYDQKEAEIKKLGKGKTYLYLKQHILPLQRRAFICMASTALAKPMVGKQTMLPEEKPEFNIHPSMLPKQEIPDVLPEPSKFWAIKTNLLQLGVGVANLGVEFPIADHFSIDIPVTYSPYTISDSWRMRTLSIQPEFRWWFNKQMQGHFVGLHTHLAYYNVSWNDKDRYQDKNGDTPLWGGGLSYGYALPLTGQWGMEFTLGLGYAYLDYDIFYNVDNGAKYATETKDYWGITRAGVTLIYKINK